MSTPSPEPDMNRNRLPTLSEVLSRRTLAPVDLFSFYIYMRDQQRSVDYLDFWLDVSQHLSLCRHFVRELRRSVLLETPEMEKAASVRHPSSQFLENFDLHDMHGGDPDRAQDQHISQYLRQESATRSQKHNSGSAKSIKSTTESFRNQPTNNTGRHSFIRSSFGDPADYSDSDSSPSHTRDSTSPRHAVARADIRASAEKILYTFLLPGSEREIILPPSILHDITESIEEQGRDDPEVFDAAKDYVFQAMERDAYPGFLRAKALGNLVPPDLMIRLIVGLLAMFAGFWAAFILIFLDKSRATRCWIILPFTIGVYALASHQYTLDPFLALAGQSEYTIANFTTIREPFVRRLIIKRALVVLWWVLWIDAALICLFVFVPGKRL